jgi:hypothetical protein
MGADLAWKLQAHEGSVMDSETQINSHINPENFFEPQLVSE